MTTRSTIIARGNFPNNVWTQVAIVPTGVCWIIKTLQFVNNGTGSANLDIRLIAASGSPGIDLFIGAVANGKTAISQMWTIAQNSDSLYVHADVDGCSYWISGTALPMPP